MSDGVTSMRENKWAAAALIVVGALFRMLSYHFSVNNGGDAAAHVTLAALWLQHPALKFNFDVYPPGHFWLIGLATLFVHDVLTAARLLSLVLGMASVVLVWKIARMLYGEAAGLLSLAVFSLYSLHIAYSTTSSAEVSAVFFLLAGLYFFFRYFDDQRDQIWRLGVSGLCLSVAESVRYEPWVLFAGLFVILVVLLRAGESKQSWPNSLRAILVFGVTGGLWPVFNIGYSWVHFGDPMHLVNLNRHQSAGFMATHSISAMHQVAVVSSALLLSLSVVAIAGALYGVISSVSTRLGRLFALLLAFYCLFQAYEFLGHALVATARFTLILGTMLAIVSGYGLQKLHESVLPNKSDAFAIVIIALLFLNLVGVLVMSERPSRFSEKFASISPRLRYGQRIEAVAGYLQTHMSSTDAVVVDDYNEESNLIVNASGFPVIPGDRAYLLSNRNGVSVNDYIQVEHPRFIVYAKDGILQHSLSLPPGCNRGTEMVNGMGFQCVFAGPIYRVYEVNYQR